MSDSSEFSGLMSKYKTDLEAVKLSTEALRAELSLRNDSCDLTPEQRKLQRQSLEMIAWVLKGGKVFTFCLGVFVAVVLAAKTWRDLLDLLK